LMFHLNLKKSNCSKPLFMTLKTIKTYTISKIMIL
jgi:hypothetical protein